MFIRKRAIVASSISLFLLGMVGCANPTSTSGIQANSKPVPIDHITDRYRDAVQTIVEATLAQNQAYERLEHVCLHFGHRLSGSLALEQAIDWAMDTMISDGQENVRREKVMVPHWVRGQESVMMVRPRVERIEMLGLGGSVGTPAEGITAPVVVVADENELESIKDSIDGKIVLFNKVMPYYDPAHGSGYGTTVKYRVHGARLAAQYGAVATLVRSVTANSMNTPHTGAMRYGETARKIPSAAITIEGAETLTRLYRKGVPVEVYLNMEARTYPDAESANVIAELRGSTHPEEIVVIGGHYDSWDVGCGAHDDAGGCIIAMEAINILRKLNMVPKRTIRVVLWTNEENGLRGGRAYAKDHAEELANHVVAIESDSGVFRPRGYGLSCIDKERERVAAVQMQAILDLINPLIPGLTARVPGGGADISPMRDAGVVLMGQRVEGSRYFDYHHSPADTIDKVDPEELSQNAAMMAAVAYVLADMPQRLGEEVTP